MGGALLALQLMAGGRAVPDVVLRRWVFACSSSRRGWLPPPCSIRLGDNSRGLLSSPKGCCEAPAAAALRWQLCPPRVLAGPGAPAAGRTLRG